MPVTSKGFTARPTSCATTISSTFTVASAVSTRIASAGRLMLPAASRHQSPSLKLNVARSVPLCTPRQRRPMR